MLEERKLWMPIQKISSTEYVGILSDDSIDRDDEIISRAVLEKWAQNNALPMLSDHKNSMQCWIGGWKNFKVISKDNNSALQACPCFFSADANPEAERIRKQIDEALGMGMNAGISIGAILKSSSEIKRDEKKYNQWDEAELLEASFVAVQSNRNANYGHIAKSFDIETKPKDVEDCVRALIADPDFKPQEGKTKEESAWAVCQARHGKIAASASSEKDYVGYSTTSIKNPMEGMKMDEKNIEEKKQVESPENTLAKQLEEKTKEIEALTKRVEVLEKHLENVSVNLPASYEISKAQQEAPEPTLKNFIAMKYGVKK